MYHVRLHGRKVETVKPNGRSALWQLVLLPLVFVLSTCDDPTTGPDLVEQPSSGPVILDESNVLAYVRMIEVMTTSQVSARGVLEPRQWSDPESRTTQPRDTVDTRSVPEQSLPRTELHPERVESFEDLIAFIGGRPSLWIELDNNVWLIVVYENGPAPTPAVVYVTVAA
jgi:hypothetical protein